MADSDTCFQTNEEADEYIRTFLEDINAVTLQLQMIGESTEILEPLKKIVFSVQDNRNILIANNMYIKTASHVMFEAIVIFMEVLDRLETLASQESQPN